jgi:tRNA dimethylallyltransferase
MMEEGLFEEVKELYESGCDLELKSMQALGYKQLINHFEGEYDLEEAIRLIKRDTRHFAKRQLNWFSRDDEIIWFDVGEYDFEELVAAVKKEIRKEL